MLYNKACEQINKERIDQQLSPLPYCDFIVESPFSSGDYHSELSCYCAFNSKENSAWLSSAKLLSAASEYIGYDFNIQRRVQEVRIQVITLPAITTQFALEASNDGFLHDVQLMIFEVPADNTLHIIKTTSAYAAQMWRVRRISETKDNSLAIASLSFVPEQEAVCKNVDLIIDKIKHITIKYNKDSYGKVLSGTEL